jgi:hypothetical protein
MNIFDIIGYTNSKQYPLNSSTSVGYFALVTSEAPPPPTTSKVYYATDNITSIYYGNTPVSSIYYGLIKVF